MQSKNQNLVDLQAFFMQAPAPMVILLGPEHRFSFANPEYIRFVGGRDVLGKTLLEAFTNEEVGEFCKLLDQVYQTGRPYHGQEMPFNLPDGDGQMQKKIVNVVYHPFRETNGTIKGVMAIHQDVTDLVLARRRVEIERANFRNLFRQTPEMVCITRGPEHVFEFVNEAHIRALGFDATGLAVRTAQPESVEVHGILDEVYRTGKTAELNEIPVTLTDRLRYFNLTYAARQDDDGRVVGVMVLGVEVTDQVRLRDEMKRAIRTRDEFLSIASHELKTPITSMKMNIQLMERKFKALKEVGAAGYLTRTNSQIDKMTKLIEDLLDVSRIQAGKMIYDFEPMDFALLYEEVMERFSDELQSSGITVSSNIEENLVGHWDKSRLEQVMVNLILNAIKYAAGTPLEISARRVDNSALIVIRDHGPGIPESKNELIFDRFERVGDASISGLGLGLYISRQIVRGHGGTIELDSSIRDGACFKVTLPITPERELV